MIDCITVAKMEKIFGLGFVTGVKTCLKLSEYFGFALTGIFHQSPILEFNVKLYCRNYVTLADGSGFK